MAGRPSKEDRKRLRREAAQSARIEEFFSYVVSPKATLQDCGPQEIVAQAKTVGVALEHRPIDAISHAFGIPGQANDLVVVIGYSDVTADILAQAEGYESLLEEPERLAIGLPMITVRAKIQFDPAVDFLHQTMLRMLGRITHGVLISGPSQMVLDDWLAWSLDYMEPNMFDLTRVYEDPPTNFQTIAERFPELKAEG